MKATFCCRLATIEVKQKSFQGVVTYTSPVEAFATGIKDLDRQKSSLIAWSLHSEALDRLILQEFKGQNVATPAKYLRKCVDRLILVAQNSSWFLDRLLKRALIAWFHFDPGRKRFSRRRLCDYPLHLNKIIMQSAYSTVTEQSLLKWNGHDCDISVHDAIEFYYCHVTMFWHLIGTSNFQAVEVTVWTCECCQAISPTWPESEASLDYATLDRAQ